MANQATTEEKCQEVPEGSPKQRQLLKSCLKPRRSCMKGMNNKPSGSPRRRREKRRVGFGRIVIDEFPQELGDNPSCSDGAPLMLGWKSFDSTTFEVESYEAYNPSDERRTKEELKLDPGVRAEMLLKAGYSMMDIVGCTMDVLKTKQERFDSYKNRKWDGWNVAMEKTSKTIRSAARRSSLLTATTAEVLISPLKSPRKKIARLRSGDKDKLSDLQSALKQNCQIPA